MNISSSKPIVSAYNFMRVLCAVLVKEKKVIIELNDVVDKIYAFKKQAGDELAFLFDDIEFRESISSVISYDIAEGLNGLQTFGVIGKLNPSYEKIVVYLTDDDANKILKEYDEKIVLALETLAKTF